MNAFMEANTDLERGTEEYEKAFWLRVFTIERAGSVLKGHVAMLMAGYAWCVPVRVKFGDKYETYHTIFTMGMPRMVEEGVMYMDICLGLANHLYGDRYNNNHNIDYDKYLLISLTQGFIFNTNATGQITHKIDDDDGIYAGRLIKIGDADRIIRRVHENRNLTQPNELVQFQIEINWHTFAHHRYLLVYATACRIGTNSLEDILLKLRSRAANDI